MGPTGPNDMYDLILSSPQIPLGYLCNGCTVCKLWDDFGTNEVLLDINLQRKHCNILQVFHNFVTLLGIKCIRTGGRNVHLDTQDLNDISKGNVRKKGCRSFLVGGIRDPQLAFLGVRKMACKGVPKLCNIQSTSQFMDLCQIGSQIGVVNTPLSSDMGYEVSEDRPQRHEQINGNKRQRAALRNTVRSRRCDGRYPSPQGEVPSQIGVKLNEDMDDPLR